MHQTSQAQMLNPSLNITTEQIQKYLDENKQLIMTILENQNMGRFAECGSHQAQLQQNLMYLARIADAQPQAQGTTMASQATPQSTVQVHYMQPSQAGMSQQPICFNPKQPFQVNDQQQLPPHHNQKQHLTQGQTRIRRSANDGGADA